MPARRDDVSQLRGETRVEPARRRGCPSGSGCNERSRCAGSPPVCDGAWHWRQIQTSSSPHLAQTADRALAPSSGSVLQSRCGVLFFG